MTSQDNGQYECIIQRDGRFVHINVNLQVVGQFPDFYHLILTFAPKVTVLTAFFKFRINLLFFS